MPIRENAPATARARPSTAGASTPASGARTKQAARTDGGRARTSHVDDEVDRAPRRGSAATTATKTGAKTGGAARRSAVHVRIDDDSRAAKPLPTTHPHRFTGDGELKWKVPPPDVLVIARRKDEDGTWVEKWQSPTTGKWVHNYTQAEIDRRATVKFQANHHFAHALPKIRAAVERDLKSGGRAQVTALVVALIDQAYFRIGGNAGAAHDHRGVTTLLKQHVQFSGRKALFDFVGKAGVPWNKTIADQKVVALLKVLHKGAPDDAAPLFSHGGRRVTDVEVNRYLAPFGVTAKQFRTFHATRLMEEGLSAAGRVPTGEREAAVARVIEQVAAQLGHEPATCRENYIDPDVVERYLSR